MVKEIDSYLNELFYLNRSITGKGNEQTLNILKEICSLDIKSIKSNTPVFDWKIPAEWNIKGGWIKDSRGNTIIDFSKSNLHVLNYSTPVNKSISFNELKQHLFYLEDKPDAIPYRTTYYKKNWGFCLSYNQYLSLDQDEIYHVFIDSELNEDGKLVYGESYKKGKSDEEILISSYLCHPSLANDNLSGVLLSCFLFRELQKIETYYSYRLVLIPETIGAIAWLYQNKNHAENIKGGFVVSCVAGPDVLGYKETFLKTHDIDKAVKYALRNEEFYKRYKFEPIGSDERQYSSPAFKIPVGTITKSKYYEYDEYHTSLDNLDFISSANLEKTLSTYLQSIFYLENNIKYKRKFNECEFMLSKLGDIYPETGGTIAQPAIVKNHMVHNYTPNSNGNLLDCIAWLSFGCDGKNTIFDIQEMSELDIDDLIYAANILKEKKLLI
jgi:aminopeptidase-like protein